MRKERGLRHMGHMMNKGMFILCSFTLHIVYGYQINSVLLLLFALFCTFSVDISKPWLRYLCIISHLFLCFFLPPLCLYLPLLMYDVYQKSYAWYYYLPFFLTAFLSIYPHPLLGLLLLFMGAAMMIKHKQIDAEDLLDTYMRQRDATREVTILMEEKNHDLLLQQDYEVRLATLNERNRIAREIHDNVGHLLSSSLLQMGALQVINQQDTLQEPLLTLKDTLNQAMTSVRSSVHDLHEEALNLEIELQKLIQQFTFCEVTLTYDIEYPLEKELIYHLLSIVKEGLHNVMKHSNATHVDILVREQPKFYQLILLDNGTKNSSSKTGIGLHNIAQRVQQYHGYLNITQTAGFRIFITLPKEQTL